MKLLVGISMAMVVALPLLAAELPQHLSGPVLVIDGDGLKIGEAEIRLFGIDAQEMRGGAAGLRSRTALEKLVADKPVACEVLNRPQRGAAGHRAGGHLSEVPCRQPGRSSISCGRAQGPGRSPGPVG